MPHSVADSCKSCRLRARYIKQHAATPCAAFARCSWSGWQQMLLAASAGPVTAAITSNFQSACAAHCTVQHSKPADRCSGMTAVMLSCNIGIYVHSVAGWLAGSKCCCAYSWSVHLQAPGACRCCKALGGNSPARTRSTHCSWPSLLLLTTSEITRFSLSLRASALSP